MIISAPQSTLSPPSSSSSASLRSVQLNGEIQDEGDEGDNEEESGSMEGDEGDEGDKEEKKAGGGELGDTKVPDNSYQPDNRNPKFAVSL